MHSGFKFFSTFFFSIALSLFALNAQHSSFVLVIDPGHGGSDPGALGRIAKEKDINLSVALRLGELIEKTHKDVKVFYTRKTDTFLSLQERADFANEKKADFFISIHTNSAKAKSAYGIETFTLGLAKSEANLEVAMRENSVILLEEDYKTKYKGFDPSSVDSYIMFEFMQDQYIDQSIELATYFQKQFSSYCKRYDRGVRQAGFWVLHRTAAPSVLVELGFISNREEERYLSSKEGQLKLATAMSKAFSEYKYRRDKKSVREILAVTDPPAEDTSSTSNNTSKPQDGTEVEALSSTSDAEAAELPVFRVQLFAKNQKLSPNAPEFKGLEYVNYYKDGEMYKYTAGEENDYRKILLLKKKLSKKYPDAFVVAFLGNVRIPLSEALKMIKQ